MNRLHFTVSITNDKQMERLNSKHRGIKHSTDVLSFELKEKLPNGQWVGEIVVSADFAKKQAKELGHSYEEEVAFLVSHGVMHLLGVHHE
jgi:probable rRNA maturation factor